MDEPRCRQLGRQALAHLLHVRQPALDDARLFRLGERVNDKGLEAPCARFDVSTADHEDERLAAALREAREIVGQVTDDLEVHVELQRGRGVPRFTARADSRRLDDGTVGVPVDTENPGQRWR